MLKVLLSTQHIHLCCNNHDLYQYHKLELKMMRILTMHNMRIYQFSNDLQLGIAFCVSTLKMNILGLRVKKSRNKQQHMEYEYDQTSSYQT